MHRSRLRVLLLFACGCACVAGDAAWQTTTRQTAAWQSKDFPDWTDKDAQALMTDSPWAKQLPLPASGRPSITVIEPGSGVNSPPTASLGNPANTTTGANMSNPAVGGSTGPAEPGGNVHNLPAAPTLSGVSANAGAPDPASVLTVIWASATPVRLAALKLRSQGEKPTADQIARASIDRPHYVIAVVGLPAPDGDSNPSSLARRAYLCAKGKAPVQALDSEYRKIGNSDVYFFRFAKTSLPLSTADREIEFKMTFGKIEVKQKFDPAEMRYKGQLAL